MRGENTWSSPHLLLCYILSWLDSAESSTCARRADKGCGRGQKVSPSYSAPVHVWGGLFFRTERSVPLKHYNVVHTLDGLSFLFYDCV